LVCAKNSKRRKIVEGLSKVKVKMKMKRKIKKMKENNYIREHDITGCFGSGGGFG